MVHCRTVADYDGEADLLRALMDLDINLKAAASEREDVAQESREEVDERSCKLKDDWDWVLFRGTQAPVPQSVHAEVKRLMDLKAYHILDAEREKRFDQLTALASRTFETPIALVSLVDIGRQWFMSNHGLGDVRETSRKVAFCAHAIQSTDQVFVVPNATKDFRFHDSPLVLGPPNIRFYAGAPLITPQGLKLGTFCIIDDKPWPNGMTQAQKESLVDFAALAVQTMEDRRQIQTAGTGNPERTLAAAPYDQVVPLSALRTSLANLAEATAQDKKLAPEVALATKTADMLQRINQETLQSLQQAQKSSIGCFQIPLIMHQNKTKKNSQFLTPRPQTNAPQLFHDLEVMAKQLPNRQVPVHLQLDASVPLTLVADDLALIRCCLNMLSTALHNDTVESVRFQISYSEYTLMLECIRRSPKGATQNIKPLICSDSELDDDSLSAMAGSHGPSSFSVLDLAHHSFANQVKVLGGKYGFEPLSTNTKSSSPTTTNKNTKSSSPTTTTNNKNNNTESVAWCSVPAPLPEGQTAHKGLTVTSLIMPDNNSKNNNKKSPNTKAAACTKIATALSVIQEEGSAPQQQQQQQQQQQGLDGKLAAAIAKTQQSVSKPPGVKFASVTDDNSSRGSPELITPVANNKSVKIPPSSLPKIPRKRKALVIEGSTISRKGVTRGFAKLDFEVTEADNADTGLQALKDGKFDITICDFMMSDNNSGIDCVKRYREWEKSQEACSPERIIIGTSARAGDKDIALGLAAGMTAFKPKPITAKVLREIIDDHVNDRDRTQPDPKQVRKNKRSPSSASNTSAGGDHFGNKKQKLEADSDTIASHTRSKDKTVPSKSERGGSVGRT